MTVALPATAIRIEQMADDKRKVPAIRLIKEKQ